MPLRSHLLKSVRLELTSHVAAVSAEYTLKPERLSPKSEAAACTPSPKLYVTLLFFLTSATLENSRSASFRCAIDTTDAASDIPGQATLLTSVAASAGPTNHAPSADMSRSPHLVLACALPTPSVDDPEHLQSCIAIGRHLRDLRTFSKIGALDEITAMTHRREPMAKL